MKIKIVLLTAILLATASIGIAQTKTKTIAAMTPDQVVKNLYATATTNAYPFFQTKKRAIVDQYFTKELADMIWKDSIEANGEVGAADFHPLFGLQETGTNLVIGKPREAGGPNNAFVEVTFKVNGKADAVDYELARGADKKWKIVGIYYSNGEDLGSTLRYFYDPEFKKEFDDNQTFTGDYTVGKVKCNVTPTLNGLKYRVECEGQEGFKLYQVEGTETETAYIYMDKKGAEKGKFVFKNDAKDGKFIDASGKESKVVPVK